MKSEISQVMDEVIKDDIWNEILLHEADVTLNDLLKLSTDYSCHGCSL